MNISELFIERPVMTALVMAAILFFGIVAYQDLPVSDLPNVDFPTIQVSASLPGASPETMASAVAQPLEAQFSTIAGVDQMSSVNNQGRTSITLQFTLNRNIDAAAQDVQAMIAKAARSLPANMPAPPTYQKVNPADQPILFLALSSPTLKLSEVDEYAETLISQRISMVSGVASVSINGAQKYAVRIQLDPRLLASRGIGLNDVVTAVGNGNVNLPTGTLYGKNQAFTVEANGQLNNAAEYRPLIVAYRNGNPVRLGDLGKVIDSVEDDKSASWFASGNHPLLRDITLSVQKQPGVNTVEVVDSIRKLLVDLQKQLPAAINLEILSDRSITIRESVQDVKFTLFLALILVVLVIFLFLRNFSATLIPSLALPMSIIGTFAIMYQLGYSLDNLSLMALTLSVGFVVDDAIVMLENIVRHTEHGESVHEASLRGSREIGFTILSMTLSLVAVFIPVLFLGGILGRLLHEFAITIGAAILVSGFVSLSLTPVLCARLLRPVKEIRHGRLYQASEKVFDWMLTGYDWTLRLTMRHRITVMVVAIVILAATVQLFMTIPKGFLPSEDTGSIFIVTEAAQGISYDEMLQKTQAINDRLLKTQYWDNFTSSIGGQLNQGRIFYRLGPRQTRPNVDQLIAQMRPKLMDVPGIVAYLQNPPSIRIGGQLTNSQYQYTLQGNDTKTLYDAAPKLQARLKQIPGLVDVSSDLQIHNPQVEVQINRDRASALGLSAQQVEDALSSAYGVRQVSTIYAPNDAFQVIVGLLPQYQTDPSVLSMLYVRNSTGQLIPLNEVADIQPGIGPLAVNHLGQSPAVTLSFNLRPGTPLSDAVANVEQAARETLPSGIRTSFQGAAAAFQSSLQGLGLLLIMAILVIYIVLGILYESFIHPITILSGLPAAGFGALVTLKLFHQDLSLYAFVGIIMLVGIVKKNAIMMIDFALETERKDGKPAAEAIYQGALVRFRPITMTTVAALVGTLPIALGYGAGGEARQPLGLAVVGGLLFSQILTLYITPVFYIYMDNIKQWVSRRKTSHAAVPSLREEEDPLTELSRR